MIFRQPNNVCKVHVMVNAKHFLVEKPIIHTKHVNKQENYREQSTGRLPLLTMIF